MQLWCLTKERKDELLKQRDAKAEELHLLRKKKPTDLWKDDLNNFITELDVRLYIQHNWTVISLLALDI